MKLENINYGFKHTYQHKPTSRLCYVVTCCHDDGACLIAEVLDEEDKDLTGDLFYTEASELEPA